MKKENAGKIKKHWFNLFKGEEKSKWAIFRSEEPCEVIPMEKLIRKHHLLIVVRHRRMRMLFEAARVQAP